MPAEVDETPTAGEAPADADADTVRQALSRFKAGWANQDWDTVAANSTAAVKDKAADAHNIAEGPFTVSEGCVGDGPTKDPTSATWSCAVLFLPGEGQGHALIYRIVVESSGGTAKVVDLIFEGDAG